MSKRLRSKKQYYLFHTSLFLAFAIILFAQNDTFLASFLFFSAMINLLAYRQLPWRIAPITVIINLFNSATGITLAYNFWVVNNNYLAVLWLLLSIAYLIASLRQIYCIVVYRLKKRLEN